MIQFEPYPASEKTVKIFYQITYCLTKDGDAIFIETKDIPLNNFTQVLSNIFYKKKYYLIP